MQTPINYLEINRNAWNQKTKVHLESEFYGMEAFMKGQSSLNDIELNLLGDVKGKTILHLQCHFGQDTLSLARMGASVTGVDLSDEAIETARQLNADLGFDARFICCNVYELPTVLDQTFDVVFTSYGTIGWLPDMDLWAGVVSRFLKPGGQFVFVEFHPVVWMFDDDFSKIGYRYFNSGALLETETGTYAEPGADLVQDYVSWNHGMAEVIQALINNGLQLSNFQEYDYSPYNCFRHTVKLAERKYRIQHLDDKIPMVYSLVAQKR